MQNRFARSNRRRGITIVSVALVGFPIYLVAAALAVDFGKIFASQGDLQRAADAAALAAAGAMGGVDPVDQRIAIGREVALQYAELNPVSGEGVTIDSLVDVDFGRSTIDPDTNKYSFTPTMDDPNAVRVRVRQTENSPNGSASLLFAQSFGVATTNISASATAAYFDDSNGDSSDEGGDDSGDDSDDSGDDNGDDSGDRGGRGDDSGVGSRKGGDHGKSGDSADGKGKSDDSGAGRDQGDDSGKGDDSGDDSGDGRDKGDDSGHGDDSDDGSGDAQPKKLLLIQ